PGRRDRRHRQPGQAGRGERASASPAGIVGVRPRSGAENPPRCFAPMHPICRVAIASVAVVAADPPESRKLFIDALGLPLEGEGDGYYSSGSISGSKHFGVWPLSQAAQACFGTPQWPAGRVVPQASIEFEVEDAEAVAAAG